MRILAVDYGDARTGLAICDCGELLASPIGVFHSGDREAVIKERTKINGNHCPICRKEL